MTDPCAGTRTWSTVGRDDAFAQWREVVCQAYTRLSPERVRDGPFAGEIRLTPLGAAGSISRISASAQKVNRGRDDIAASPCEAVFVNIQVGGRSLIRQRGEETRLDPGSLVLLDARRPFEMRFDGPFRQICLHLPIAWLEEQAFDPGRAAVRRLDRRSTLAAALLDHVAELTAPAPAPPLTEADGGDVVHLLQLAYTGDDTGTLADRHLAMLRRFVAEHSADPDLTPGAVAGHFRMSRRYLHKLFARSGESFGRYLLRCRLEACRRALIEGRSGSVLEIALAAGFSDASHFSRSFRRRFGVTPSEMRREVSLLRGANAPRNRD